MSGLITIGQKMITDNAVDYFVKKYTAENSFRISAFSGSGLLVGFLECEEKEEFFFKEKRFYCTELFLAKGWDSKRIATLMCNLSQQLAGATIYPLYMSLHTGKPVEVDSVEAEEFWNFRLKGDGFLADYKRRRDQYTNMPRNQYSQKR